MREARTKQIGVVVPPSLEQRLKKLAHLRSISMNQLVNEVLLAYADNHQSWIDSYDKMQDELKIPIQRTPIK